MHTAHSLTSFLALLLLTGCASQCVPTVVEKPVIVERATTVPLPPDFLSPCLGLPPALPADATNGDLLMSYVGRGAYITCLESRLEAIRQAQPR